jgi:hypothetical protein
VIAGGRGPGLAGADAGRSYPSPERAVPSHERRGRNARRRDMSVLCPAFGVFASRRYSRSTRLSLEPGSRSLGWPIQSWPQQRQGLPDRASSRASISRGHCLKALCSQRRRSLPNAHHPSRRALGRSRRHDGDLGGGFWVPLVYFALFARLARPSARGRGLDVSFRQISHGCPAFGWLAALGSNNLHIGSMSVSI